MQKPIEITVNGAGPYDPVAGTSDCNIPTLTGQDLWISKAGYGPYNYSLYSVISTGGFRLIGDTFQPNEKFFVFAVGVAFGTTSGTYTNGFNYAKVVSALFGRVGWGQSAGDPVLNSNNLLSKSGRLFNDGSFHSLVNLSNINQVMDKAGVSDVDFNTYLEALQKAVILRTLNGVFCTPEYISQSLLYTRWNSNDEVINNGGKFVGVRIKVPPAENISVQLDSVALYFNEAKTFNLYLFNDVKKAPIWTGSITTVANSQVIVNLSDIVLGHLGGDNHGGIFYFGYFQNDLGTAKAIDESNINYPGYRFMYLAHHFESDSVGASDFDRKEISTTTTTFGINPHISVFRDHTWQIIAKAALFDNVIGLQMAAQVIEQTLYSARSNSGERSLKDAIDKNMGSLALEGYAPISDGPQTVGLKKQIAAELMRMRDSFFPKAKPQIISLC